MKKYENFDKALVNLQDIYKYDEPYDNVVLTGLVGLFEICFEQSWKAMKEILEDQGFQDTKAGSPRMVIKLAYSVNMISDEDKWLEALLSRNNVTHAYNHNVAIEIVRKTKNCYVELFNRLKAEIEANWQ
jgi:nucleotidyltransferase substrate binding protein (TIGR01987 family)